MTGDDLLGTRLGRFEIVDRISEGASAVVYRARQLTMGGRLVALKVLKEFESSPDLRDDWVKSFRREAELIARLQHPNILPVFDAGEDRDRLFLAMQLVEAGTLHHHLATYREAGETVPFEQLLRIIRQIAAGLDYAHAEDIIHRDVKPLNVLMDRRLHCFVSDFGISKLIDGSQTHTKGIKGTPYYMSPEQCLGESPDARSDLYALGVILYEMVVGNVPFRADNTTAVLLMQVQAPPVIPESTLQRVPDALREVILKSLAKSRQDRFSSGAQLVAALEAALGPAGHASEDQMETVCTPSGVHTPKRRFPRGRVAALAAMVLVALLAIFGASKFYSRGQGASSASTGPAAPSGDDGQREEPAVAEPVPAKPWAPERSDFRVALLWHPDQNPNVNAKLGPWRAAVATGLRAVFPLVERDAVGDGESADALARLPAADFQSRMADLEAEAALVVELTFVPGIPGPDDRWLPQLGVTATLFTRDDGQRGPRHRAALVPSAPSSDVFGGLATLETDAVIATGGGALEAWYAEVAKSGRRVRFLYGSAPDSPTSTDALTELLRRVPGVEPDSLRTAGASLTAREVATDAGAARIRLLQARQLWRRLEFRYRGEPGELLGALESRFRVPARESTALPAVERVGNLIILDRLP